MESTGTVLAVTGAKGGVGKTTTSINLCATFAAMDIETVLVEFDLAMANVVDFLTFGPTDEPDPTMHEVLAGEEPVDAATYEVGSNFAVLPSGTSLDGYAETDLDDAAEVIDELCEAYDAVVLDTGAGLNAATVTPMRLADGVVVVSTPRVASIRDADKTRTLADRLETDVFGLVLTKSGTGNAPGADRIAEFLDTRLLGHVPEDDAVPVSQDQGQPLIQCQPDSDAAQTYQKIGRVLAVGCGLSEQSLSTSASRPETTVQTDAQMVGDGGVQAVPSSGSPAQDTTASGEQGVTVSDQSSPETGTADAPPAEGLTSGTNSTSETDTTSARAVAVNASQETDEDDSSPDREDTTPDLGASGTQDTELTDDDAPPVSDAGVTSESDSRDTDCEGRSSPPDESGSEESSSVLSRFVSVFR